MFDSTLAFTRYRLEVVKGWPDGDVKDALLTAIEHSLNGKGQPEDRSENRGRPEQGSTARWNQ